MFIVEESSYETPVSETISLTRIVTNVRLKTENKEFAALITYFLLPPGISSASDILIKIEPLIKTLLPTAKFVTMISGESLMARYYDEHQKVECRVKINGVNHAGNFLLFFAKEQTQLAELREQIPASWGVIIDAHNQVFPEVAEAAAVTE